MQNIFLDNKKISTIVQEYFINELEFFTILNKSIKDIFHSDIATYVSNNKIIIGNIENKRDIVVQHKSINIDKKQMNKIALKLHENLLDYSIKNRFDMFFDTQKIYKAIPYSIDGDNVILKIPTSNKSPLYMFKHPIALLSYRQIVNIKQKKFFNDNNVMYISIEKPKGKEVLCSCMSKKALTFLFEDLFYFLKRKYKKDYKIKHIRVQVDIFLKDISFHYSLEDNINPTKKFKSSLFRLLDLKIGKVKVFLLDAKLKSNSSDSTNYETFDTYKTTWSIP